jgi:hypothetical protein
MPVIPAMQEAEIGRITVSGQPREKVFETSSQWKKLDIAVCTCYPGDGKKLKIGGLWFMLA